MDDMQKLRDVLGRFDAVMLVTFDDTGLLNGRPMTRADIDDDGRVWFVAHAESDSVEQVLDIEQAALVGQRRLLQCHVNGRASVHRDVEKARDVWSETMRVWFPDGPESDDLVLIAFEPLSATVWDATGTRLLRLAWSMVKAYAQGRKVGADADLVEHLSA